MLTELCADKRGDTWALLARTLLSCVAEGAKLGPFLAKFHLSESTLANLLNLDNNLKPAWINIMVSGVIVSYLCYVEHENEYFQELSNGVEVGVPS